MKDAPGSFWKVAPIVGLLERVSSQLHNLKVGLRQVCSTATLCDKSHDAEDASTTLGEFEPNLTGHRLMSPISEA